MVILLLLLIVSYKLQFVHKLLVNSLVKLAQEKVFRLTDCLDMTIVVDWDVKQQTKKHVTICNL